MRPLTYPCRLLSPFMDKTEKMNEWVWKPNTLLKHGRNLDPVPQLAQKDYMD